MSRVNIELVRARRARIAREIELLRAEEAELALAEAALERLARSIGVEPPRSEDLDQLEKGLTALHQASVAEIGREPKSDSGWVRPATQRDYILKVLEEASPPWVHSRDIQAVARERWGVVLPIQSLRPLLTSMKTKGVIVRKGRLIALRRRVEAFAQRA